MRFAANRYLALLAAAVGVVLAAGCGGDAGEEGATPSEAPPPTQPAPPAAQPAPPASSTVVVPGRTRLTVTAEDGTPLEYTLVVPDGWEVGGEYPVLLALPPGGQGPEEVDAGLRRYWEEEALARGWVVVSPVAPGGELFFEGAEEYVPTLLSDVERLVRPEQGHYHLAGISNGGLSAFRIATEYPERFVSLLALPGHPPDAEAESRLDRLTGIRVWMLVGSEDDEWREAAEATRETLRQKKVDATLTVYEGQGHILDVDPAALYDFLDATRPSGAA
jgi:predicted esterase